MHNCNLNISQANSGRQNPSLFSTQTALVSHVLPGLIMSVSNILCLPNISLQVGSPVLKSNTHLSPLFLFTSCTRVFDYLSHKVRQVERKSQIQLVRVSSPKYLISWQTSTAGNKERSKVRAGKKEKTTAEAGFSSFHDSEITLFHLPQCKADSWKHCTTWWKLKFPYGK